MTVEKQVNDLVINKMTKAQFDALENHSDTELYIVVDSMPVISYNDLTDKPSIGEGTLTIEKNGTSIGTFNANTNSNKTISFSVPITVAELSDSNNYALVSQLPSEATSSTLGLVKPDGTTITVSNGVLSYANGNGYITADSPTLTGTPTAPTQSFGDNTTKIATTEFVQTAIDNIDALPAQSGNDGKYLKTNGTSASWENLIIPEVDQTYSSSSTSANALSHKAIAGAGFLQNTATGSQSLAIGPSSTAPNSWSVAIGTLSSATAVSTAIGWNAKAGDSTNNTSSCVAIGRNALASGDYSTCVGEEAEASGDYSVAIGIASKATARNAIQIGFGTNNTASTLRIGFGRNGYSANYELLNGTTGKIPDDRLNTTIARTSDYYTKAEIDAMIGNIEAILQRLNSGNN